MFFVKGFAGRRGAAQYSRSAVAVIGGSNIAATIAGAKRGERSVEPPTCVIGRARKGDWINGIVSRPIGAG